jgi:hypothetical protein
MPAARQVKDGANRESKKLLSKISSGKQKAIKSSSAPAPGRNQSRSPAGPRAAFVLYAPCRPCRLPLLLLLSCQLVVPSVLLLRMLLVARVWLHLLLPLLLLLILLMRLMRPTSVLLRPTADPGSS